MSFSPVFQHRLAAVPEKSFSPVFQHRIEGGELSSFSPVFQHRIEGGFLSSFSPVFQHIAEVNPLGRIRGDQIEPILKLERCIDFPESPETNAPAGFIRAFAENGAPRWVNPEGRVFRVDLEFTPVGGVLPYWPPEAVIPGFDDPPENFEWCDGTAVSTVGSPMFGLFKPRLMSTSVAPSPAPGFPRGTVNGAASMGGHFPFITGGTEAHEHDLTTSVDGIHCHDAGNHVHKIYGEPPHNHGGITSGANTGNTGKDFVDDAPLADFEEHDHTIIQDGDHNHGGFTETGFGEVADSGAHDHVATSDAQDHLPPWVELAWIVRVL